MGQILVWECEDTGDLFKEETKYRAHRRKVIAAQEAEKKRLERLAQFKTRMAALHKLTDLDAIARWCVRNWPEMAHGSDRRWYRGKLVRMRFDGTYNRDGKTGPSSPLRYNNCASNSHNAPLGKRTNWCGHAGDDVPRGYPGWEGSVDLCCTGRIESDALKRVGICTGGGGGGGSCGQPKCEHHLRYAVTLWAHDFRTMFRQERQPLIDEVNRFIKMDEISLAKDWYSFTSAMVKLSNEYRIDFDRKQLTSIDKEWEEFQKVTHTYPQNAVPLLRKLFPSYRAGVLRDIVQTQAVQPAGMLRLGSSQFVLAHDMDSAVLGLMNGSFTQDDRFFDWA